MLTIQLLRFVYDIELQRKRKVGHTVRIPDTLDLSDYVSTDTGTAGVGGDGSEEETHERALPTIYRLSSILYHKGNSADMGHYVAEVQNHALRKWYVLQSSRRAEPAGQPRTEASHARLFTGLCTTTSKWSPVQYLPKISHAPPKRHTCWSITETTEFRVRR